MERVELTPWQRHRDGWQGGCGHSACGRAAKRVLARGVVPAEVLFVGEAPGISENRTGLPFDGPAGNLLDVIVLRAEENAVGYDPSFVPFRKAFGNLVACIPLDPDGSKWTEPPDDQVKRCSSRLVDLVEVCQARLVVCVGKLAWEWLDPAYKHHVRLERQVHFAQVMHPAAILRAPLANKEMLTRRAVVVLRDAFLNLFTLSDEE